MNNQTNSLFAKAEDYFAKSIARRTRDFDGAASAYSTDINDEPMNSLVLRKPVLSLDELIKDSIDFFAHITTWCVVLPAQLVDKDTTASLERYGFIKAEISVAMVLSLDGLKEEPEDHASRNMDNDLDTWSIPLRAYPNTSDEISIKYAQSHKLALQRKRNLSHVSLFDNGNIISSLTISWNDNWARIDDVATLPEYQGRGFATKLMRHALCLAQEKGAQLCFLEASPKGLSIYQRLGFEELFKNQIFVKKLRSA